ncbi:MAG TPA: hypothetical protein VN721_09705 [Flavipsychrobacter sp.]|nr:hypothetical protein [Flavipsychrobacter sp.]
MKKCLLLAILLLFVIEGYGQPTFNTGWHTYKATTLYREYNYNISYKDSFRIWLSDSTQVFISPDSSITMSQDHSLYDKVDHKTVNYFGKNKQINKKEEYRNDVLQHVSTWKYDTKNRLSSYSVVDEHKNTNITKTYEYDKTKDGESTVTECSYFNGRVEFYTTDYYDKRNVKYKEVRLNDNRKDVVHIESYKYDASGKLKERSVFFPEFRVTKKFVENGGDSKCYKQVPANKETASAANKEAFIKKQLIKYQSVITGKGCEDMEYHLYFIKPICELIIKKERNKGTVCIRFKESYK